MYTQTCNGHKTSSSSTLTISELSETLSLAHPADQNPATEITSSVVDIYSYWIITRAYWEDPRTCWVSSHCTEDDQVGYCLASSLMLFVFQHRGPELSAYIKNTSANGSKQSKQNCTAGSSPMVKQSAPKLGTGLTTLWLAGGVLKSYPCHACHAGKEEKNITRWH